MLHYSEVREDPAINEFFAAPRHPYAQALLRALPGAARRDAPLEAIAGTVPPLTQQKLAASFKLKEEEE